MVSERGYSHRDPGRDIPTRDIPTQHTPDPRYDHPTPSGSKRPHQRGDRRGHAQPDGPHHRDRPHHRDTSPHRGAPLRLLRRRIIVLVIVLLLMLGTLVARLTQVQLLEPAAATTAATTTEAADPTQSRADRATIPIPALRGRILDRHGVPLVHNTTQPALLLDRAALAAMPDEGEALFSALAETLDSTTSDLRARTTSCGAPAAAPPPICTPGSPAAPAVLAPVLDPLTALAIAERPERYPGVTITPVPGRAYPHPEGVLAPHVLGYLAPSTNGDTAGDVPHDLVGRTGLEQQYDQVLRGTPGQQTVRTDPRGIPLEVIDATPPQPGKDVRTHLDANLQGVIERTLAERVQERQDAGKAADGAAAVVIDLADGGVRALASYPTYDPVVWIGGIASADYDALTAPDSAQPLISRVTEVGLPPASTFKVVTMPAAIRAGNPLDGSYQCPSSYTIGGREFRNFRSQDYGTIDWREAMAVSCDTIFYDVAYRSWLAQGGTAATDDDGDPFVRTARDFGLGRPTGIDLPGEASGRIPDRAWRQAQWEATKDELCERAQTGYPEVADAERRAYLTQIAAENCVDGHLYRGGDAANFSIGQGDILTTPLQMAQVFAAIATGGPTFTPQLADAFLDPRTGTEDDLAPTPAPPVPLEPTVADYLRDSLEAVVTEGTAAETFAGFPLEEWPVAGKTGTAEMLVGNDTSWFVSYAPADSPRYVVAVAVTQAGLGSEAAVPISRVIHDELRRLP